MPPANVLEKVQDVLLTGATLCPVVVTVIDGDILLPETSTANQHMQS